MSERQWFVFIREHSCSTAFRGRHPRRENWHVSCVLCIFTFYELNTHTHTQRDYSLTVHEGLESSHADHLKVRRAEAMWLLMQVKLSSKLSQMFPVHGHQCYCPSCSIQTVPISLRSLCENAFVPWCIGASALQYLWTWWTKTSR